MQRVRYKGNDFETEHEAICSALFDKYGWRWERPKHPLDGWLPDFRLRGDTDVLVECKGGLEWDDVRNFQDLQRYEDAVHGTDYEVLLIPKAPRNFKNRKGYDVSALGFLYDREVWSYAELGRWSGSVGFCHSANAWRDRLSGHNVNLSSGDGQRPDVELDWRSVTQAYRGKRMSYFKESTDSEIEDWDTSHETGSRDKTPF